MSDGTAMDDGGVGRMARSTERPYHLQPWAQRCGADGTEVRDGSDDSAHGQGAEARCPWLQIHGGEGDTGRGSARRGGEPAGAPTLRGGDYPVATPFQPPCRPGAPAPAVASVSPLCGPVFCTGAPPSGGLSGDRHALRRGPHPCGSHARSAVRCSDSHGVMGQRSTGVKTYGMLLVQYARTASNDCF
jgi:hypothetical protein